MRIVYWCIAALLTGSLSAEASPILYQLAFDGSSAGDAGVGSFLWDEKTGVMTEFGWDFNGSTGGITNEALAVERKDGGTLGGYLYTFFASPKLSLEETIVEDIIGLRGGNYVEVGGDQLYGKFPSPKANATVSFCVPGGIFYSCGGGIVEENLFAPRRSGVTYTFTEAYSDGADQIVVASGGVTAKPTTVPEPSVLVLFASSLACLGMARRRARRSASEV